MRIYFWDHNNVLEVLRPHFNVVTSIEEADVVLVWNDVNPMEQSIISLAKAMGKKTAVMQHGRKGSSKYYPPFSEKITADLYLAWGDFDKRALVAEGNDPKKIKVVGCPLLPLLPPRNRTRSGNNIVFCPEHWDREVEENLKVRDELKKVHASKYNVITKLIENHDSSQYFNVVQTGRGTAEHLPKTFEVLHVADLVVGISESTFELFAQAMDIPVVIMEEWSPKAFGGDMRYTSYRRLISKAAKRTSVEKLLETIEDQLANPEDLAWQRRQVAVDEGGLGLDTPTLVRVALEELC